MTHVLLGKNLFDILMFMLMVLVSGQTLKNFFVFRLPEMGGFHFIVSTSLSISIGFAICFLMVWQGLKKSQNLNPKKVALELAFVVMFCELIMVLSKIIYLNVPENAIERLLLLIAFDLFIGIYFLVTWLMRKNVQAA